MIYSSCIYHDENSAAGVTLHFCRRKPGDISDKMLYICGDCDMRTTIADVLIENKRLKEELANSAPVVHGKWGRSETMYTDTVSCSACGAEYIDDTDIAVDEWAKYCPNCGARMDGLDEEEHGE